MRSPVALVLSLATGAVLALRETYEPDLFWRLAQGREIASGRLLHTNLFSYTFTDYAQPYTSWGFELLSYAAFRVGGAAALQLMTAIAVGLALWLAFIAARLRAPAPVVIATIALGIAAMESRVMPRPATWSFVFLALVVWLVERARSERRVRPLLLALPVACVWSNVHVEVMFGVALVGLFGAGELVLPNALSRKQALQVLGVTALTLLCTLFNPYGIGIVRYLQENGEVPKLLRIAELMPPYLPSYAAHFVYVAFAALVFVWSRRASLAEWLVLVAFAALSLRHLRLSGVLVFATLPSVSAALATILRHESRRYVVALGGIWAALLVLRFPLPAYWNQARIGGDALAPRSMFSAAAVRFIRERGLTGPVYNSNNLGGFLAWELHPQVQVFSDGRLQAYPLVHFERMLHAYQDQAQWDDLVRGVDWAVLANARRNELSGAGRFPASAWATVFRDDAVEILVRKSGRYGGIAP